MLGRVVELAEIGLSFVGLLRPTPERLRRRARRKTRRAQRLYKRGKKRRSLELVKEAQQLREDADKLARGE